MSAPKTAFDNRNGYSSKTLRPLWARFLSASLGTLQSTFEPQIIRSTSATFRPSRQVLAMYAVVRANATSLPIEGIYGFRMHTNRSPPSQAASWKEVEAWRNRPLQSFYPFAFVDCIYVYRCARSMASSRWVVCAALALRRQRLQGMSLASGSTRRRAACLDADLRRAAARGVKDLGIRLAMA